MRRTKTGYAKDWSNYNGLPATTYYKAEDVDRAAQHYGARPGAVLALATSADWNGYGSVGAFIAACVQPYRVVSR